jgi:hypothetical protein
MAATAAPVHQHDGARQRCPAVSSEPTLGAYGITYYSGKIWIVTRGPLIYTVDTGDLSVDSIDIGFPFATPRNIRAALGFLWVPTMADDRVIQINPDGTIEDVHTGFDQPWDIFATDSVVWAMQLGSIAIKRVAQF